MRKLQNVCGIVVAMTLVLALAVAPSSGVSAQDQVPPQHLKEVPQEVLDFFGDGLTIEEFLSQTNGYIPFALKEYAEQDVTVIVEMTEPALAAKLVAENKLPSQMSPLSQAAYTNSLKLAQKPVKELVLGAKGLVLGEYTKAYNGVMVRIAAKELSAIRALAGVKAVHKAPVYEINLDASVPLIGANGVWASPDGYAGEGVTIAIIDTGIDYTHASFGGPGTAVAYSTNDPDIIEVGTFPTAKVIGGYDFAGTAYDAGGTGAALIPVPDPDPLDEGGHGSHVASTSAGFEVVDGLTTKIGSGVAPDALLYALKVFGADGSTDLVVSALEWAMDPNGDGDISDHVDVVNMSLGSSFGPGDIDDPDVVASNNAVGVGVIVVTSSGNSGNVEYITGSPGTASGNLSVAASTTGSGMMPFIKYEGTEVPYLPSISFTSTTPVTLVDVDMVDDTGTGLLCNVAGANPVLTPADALSGKLALIQRGVCSFEEKLVNAQELGAVGAIIFNASTSANDYISMLTGAATIPAGHTLYSYGVTLKGLHNLVVTVGPDTNVKRFPSVTPADYVATFSSRGPRGTDSILKPEVTAPGVAIFAAQMGSGSEGVSFNGTSMASPHVAGVAALVRQAHPDWTVEQVKAAIMNTAVDMNPADVNGYQVVPRTGAGRVDAYEAVFTDYVAVGDEDLVSLSWGVIEIEPNTAEFIAPDVKTVRVYNDTAAPINFTITSTISGNAGLMGLEMPAAVTVAPHSWQAFPVILHILPTGIVYDFFNGELPEFYGFVELTETTVGDVELRVPFYFVARPVSKLTVTGTPDLTVGADMVDEAQIDLAQTGPTAANLWAYSAMHVDGNDLAQLDEADQRMIGMDYVGFDGDDDLIGVAVNTWASVHNPQPYFAEHDIYIDADQDGNPETVNFNFNYGWLTGAGSSNVWIVVQVDLVGGGTYLGSPYSLVTDFNSGVVEYILPASWNYIDNVGGLGADTDYTVEVVSFDYNGNIDASPVMYYDNARPPFGFALLDGTPFNSPDTLSAWVNDLSGYFVTQPKGVMLLDYQGKPGVGQAYFWPLSVEGVPTNYLPFMSN